MQPSDNRPQDASAAQGVPPKDYAMLVLEDEDTEAYVADAQTVYVAETVLTKVHLLEGRFTDAEFRAWCLEMQTRHVIPFQNAHIMTAWVSDDDWPDMSDYITHGWAMINYSGRARSNRCGSLGGHAWRPFRGQPHHGPLSQASAGPQLAKKRLAAQQFGVSM